MQRPSTLAVMALVIGTSACAGPGGQHLSAAEYQRMQQDVGAAEADVGRARTFNESQRELEGESQDLVWEREDVEHESAELRAKRERVALEHARAKGSQRLDVTRGERELAWAHKDLEHFDKVERARRQAEDSLMLEMAAANLLETREELAQLEIMYEGSQLGEATAEIVLERTRRRLAMSEKRHHIAEEKSAELRAVVLPRELEEHLAEVADKQLALENAHTSLRLASLEREADQRKLDHEQVALDRRLETIARKRSDLGVKLRGHERDAADTETSP